MNVRLAGLSILETNFLKWIFLIKDRIFSLNVRLADLIILYFNSMNWNSRGTKYQWKNCQYGMKTSTTLDFFWLVRTSKNFRAKSSFFTQLKFLSKIFSPLKCSLTSTQLFQWSLIFLSALLGVCREAVDMKISSRNH